MDFKEFERRPHKTQLFTWIILFIFAPVGIFLLWRNNFYSKKANIIISVFFMLFFISILFTPDSKNQTLISVILSKDSPIVTQSPEPIPTPSPTLTVEEVAAIEKAKADKIEQDKKAAEKAEADKAAKKILDDKLAAAKAEEEKIGYDTGITYNQLARTPNDYMGKKVKFTGKVVQVMEGDGETQLRIAVNDDYDTILYVAYKSEITNTRILEKDNVTVRGLSAGLLTYESTLGGNISIPSVLVQKIDLNQ